MRKLVYEFENIKTHETKEIADYFEFLDFKKSIDDEKLGNWEYIGEKLIDMKSK